jgi:putative FmdB family regulatory protein
MPVYEFVCSCKDGKHTEERVLKISERDSDQYCSNCGKKLIRKTFGSLNLHGFDQYGRSK